MTRKEFSDKYDAYMREGSRYGVVIVVLIVALCGFSGTLGNYLREHYQTGWSDNVMALGMIAVLIGVVVVLFFQGRSWAEKYGLVCSACNGHLTDKVARRKVLLTGECPKCRTRVFNETDVKAVKSCRLNREEFKAKLDRFTRETNRQFTRLLVLMITSIIASIPITKYFQHLVDRGGLNWVTQAQWQWFPVLLLGAVCVAAVGIFILAFRGKFKIRPSLPCPSCGRSLIGFGRAAIESGMCVYCGCRLFEEPSEREHV